MILYKDNSKDFEKTILLPHSKLRKNNCSGRKLTKLRKLKLKHKQTIMAA